VSCELSSWTRVSTPHPFHNSCFTHPTSKHYSPMSRTAIHTSGLSQTPSSTTDKCLVFMCAWWRLFSRKFALFKSVFVCLNPYKRPFSHWLFCFTFAHEMIRYVSYTWVVGLIQGTLRLEFCLLIYLHQVNQNASFFLLSAKIVTCYILRFLIHGTVLISFVNVLNCMMNYCNCIEHLRTK